MREEIYKKEIKDLLLDRYIENLSMACNLIDTIIPVVKRFDCKVYNVRFEKAIKEVINQRLSEIGEKEVYPHFELSLQKIQIYLGFYCRQSVRTENDYGTLPSGYTDVTICYHWTDWSSWNNEVTKKYHYKNNGEFYYLDENGNFRLQAEKIISLLLEKKKEIEEEVKELTEEKKHVEEKFREVEELKEKLSRLHNSIPSVIGSIYDIKSYGNYC